MLCRCLSMFLYCVKYVRLKHVFVLLDKLCDVFSGLRMHILVFVYSKGKGAEQTVPISQHFLNFSSLSFEEESCCTKVTTASVKEMEKFSGDWIISYVGCW